MPLSTDLHSHLLPNLDDGVDSYDESLFIIESLAEMGYKKLITTPHIMQDFYNNSVESINAKMTELRSILKEEGIDMQVEAAAEYYLDDHLMQIIDDESQELLLFGNNYMLFETSFMNQPFYLNEFIFKAKSRGINPILAHPERYAYIQSNPDLIDDLITRGVYLQLNINSITGYYSRQVRKMAERMIDNKKIHFLGSDCHNKNHLQVMQRSVNEKYYTKALRLPLLNNSL
ncbi:capsular biosynthesis protein [Fulvivirga sp. RKSG066]|nr:capsular biosynthesis protein [Fulvivirga aurantia]